MNYRIIFAFAALAFSALVAAQQPQGTVIEGLPIGLGDSIEKVRAALGTDQQPIDSKSAVRKNTKQLRLTAMGIWVFFDQDGKVYNIRLDAPFAGSIGGVRIGDSWSTLVERLGKPARVLEIPGKSGQQPYLYHLDDRTSVRFDFNLDGEVETVFIVTRAA